MIEICILAIIFLAVMFNHKSNNNSHLRELFDSAPDACWEWAFGEHWRTQLLHELDECWNLRHGDLFTLQGSDLFDKSVNRIKDAYFKQVEVVR